MGLSARKIGLEIDLESSLMWLQKAAEGGDDEEEEEDEEGEWE